MCAAQRDFDDIGFAYPMYELGGSGSLSLKRGQGSIGAQIKKISNANGYQVTRDTGGGVVFATYAGLIGKSKKDKKERYHDLIDWLKGDPSGDQGLIAFDEAHKAKNLIPPTFDLSGYRSVAKGTFLFNP